MGYRKSVTFTQARQLIADWSTEHHRKVEVVALDQAISRVVAENLIAEEGVPMTDCSAVDGYAVAFSSLQQVQGGGLQFNPSLAQQSACSVIYSGQELPDFADTVIGFNQLIGDERGILNLTSELKKGDNIYSRHSDLRPKQKLIKKGERITTRQLSLLASAAYSALKVRKKPTVVLLTISGQQPSTSKPPFDGKLEMLKTLLDNMGCQVVLVKTIENRSQLIQAVFDKLKVKQIDFVLMLGSVVVANSNRVVDLLAENGQVAFHQVRVTPGSSLFFGRLGHSLFFGLPTDAVAAFSSVCQFVWPAIKKTLGENDDDLLWRGKITHELEKKHFRREFVRAFFIQTIDGGLEVTACGGQQSNRLKPLTEANCFMILDESDQTMRAGEVVRIQPFHQFAAKTV